MPLFWPLRLRSGEKLAQAEVKSMRDPLGNIDRNVGEAALDLAHRRPMDLRLLLESLLRYVPFFPKATDSAAQPQAQSCHAIGCTQGAELIYSHTPDSLVASVYR